LVRRRTKCTVTPGLPENRKSPQITTNHRKSTANQPHITANQAQHNVILPENRKSPQIAADIKQTVNR